MSILWLFIYFFLNNNNNKDSNVGSWYYSVTSDCNSGRIFKGTPNMNNPIKYKHLY